MAKKPKIYTSYPTLKSKYYGKERGSAIRFENQSSNYKQIFDFLKSFLGINVDKAKASEFSDIIKSVLGNDENKNLFNTYMQSKVKYESKQYQVKMLFSSFLEQYAKETGIELPFLDQDFQSADDLEGILIYIQAAMGSGGTTSDLYYGQLRKQINELKGLEQKYAQDFIPFAHGAEHAMSNLRSKLYNIEQQEGKTIEDKFSYAFFRSFKTSDGIEKLKVDFLDANAVARKTLEQDMVKAKLNFSPEGFVRGASLFQDVGFTDEDFAAMQTKDKNLQNLAARINSDEDFLTAIQTLSKTKYKTNSDVPEKQWREVGLGRAADILFRQYDYETGWDKKIPTITNKEMNENIAGLLVGDKTINIVENEKIIRHQISVKTQNLDDIRITYANSAITEAMYWIGQSPTLLSKVLLENEYVSSTINGKRISLNQPFAQAALEFASAQGYTYLLDDASLEGEISDQLADELQSAIPLE